MARPEQEKRFKALMVEIRPLLLKALSSMLSFAEAEEVIQESFFKLFLADSEQTIENPKAYVYRVSRNLALNRLRNQSVSKRYSTCQNATSELNNDMSVPSPSRLYHLNEEKQTLLNALNHLPPICRQVFVMRKLHGKSHRDIALALGITEKTVENHIANGMKATLAILKRSNATNVAPHTTHRTRRNAG